MKHYVLKKNKKKGESMEKRKGRRDRKPYDIDLDISDPVIKEFI